MSDSSSAPRRWWQKLFSRRSGRAGARQPVRLSATPSSVRRPGQERRAGIEPLEGRIAPAALLPGGLGISYTDFDGDHVAVHFSQPIFGHESGATLLADFARVFTFSTGDVHSDSSVEQQLLMIDLSTATHANGVSISVTVTGRGDNGNGVVDVGAISAFGTPLGKVRIQGDLGQIDSGDGSHEVGLASLQVKSLGVRTDTQSSASTSYTSSILGRLGSLTADIVLGAYVNVTGDIGTVNIAHHLAARDLSATTANDGQIQALGKIGTLIIGSANHPTDDAIIGGSADNSAAVLATGNIGVVRITGNLHGSEGALSASVTSGKNIGSVVVHGQLLGDAGDSSGFIRVSGNISSAVIGTGSGNAISGGSGDHSGGLIADEHLGTVILHGGLAGGAGIESGRLSAGTTMGAVTVQGSVVGATDTESDPTASNHNGSIESDGTMGAVIIIGNLTGGDGDNSGFIGADSLPSLRITGNVSGGGGDASGAVHVNAGGLSLLQVSHGLLGGLGDDSGVINIAGGLGSATVGRAVTGGLSIQGGDGDGSGLLIAGHVGTAHLLGGITGGTGLESGGLAAVGLLSSLQVDGSITGVTTGYHNGYIDGGSLGRVTIDGSVVGGGDHAGLVGGAGAITSVKITGAVQGGTGAFSGAIVGAYGGSGQVASIAIGHGLIGGDGDSSGVVTAGADLGKVRISPPAGNATAIAGGAGNSSGSIYADGAIGTVTVKGSVAGGTGDRSGSIEGHGQVGQVTLGNLQGGAGDLSGTILSDDLVTDADVKSGRIGSVQAGQIMGGAGANSGSVRADGSIGHLTAAALQNGTAADGGTIATGLGLYDSGDATSISIKHLGTSSDQQAGGTISVRGTLGQFSATEVYHATLQARTLGTLTVGSIDSSTITALGQPETMAGTDVAIARILISGSVSHTEILAGVDFDGVASNGHAQIGTVSVGGAWTASDLVAGARDVNGDGYGNADDTAVATGGSTLLSSIAKITIKGALAGDGTSPSYGFEAESIGAFRAGATVLPLSGTTPAQVFADVVPGVSVREVSAPL